MCSGLKFKTLNNASLNRWYLPTSQQGITTKNDFINLFTSENLSSHTVGKVFISELNYYTRKVVV
jgi:hypothetical protein